MSAEATFLLPSLALPADALQPGLVYQSDHAGEAESRLLAQFDDAKKLHALVRALVSPLQQFEQAAFEVLGAFDVDAARGTQLDVVGGFVGVPREARSDVAYRAYIKAKILGNASDGAAETILRIARTLLGPDVLSLTYVPGWVENHPAHYSLEIAASTLRFPWDVSSEESPDVVARAVADAIFVATSAGISLTLFYQYTDDAHAFVFSSIGDAEEDSASQGLADTSDEELTGGALIGAEERF
jgi:hypothetical protein